VRLNKNQDKAKQLCSARTVAEKVPELMAKSVTVAVYKSSQSETGRTFQHLAKISLRAAWNDGPDVQYLHYQQ